MGLSGPRALRFRTMRSFVAFGGGLALFLGTAIAAAAPTIMEGDVPNDGLDHFFLPFEVPAGTKEIKIKHSDESDSNILDWGVYDQNGYRGWGGGTSEDVVINELAASRAYVPGPLTPGQWRVIAGKAKIESSPAKYHVEIECLTEATLAPQVREPYVPAAARRTERRYYAGDLHAHSLESTDADPSLQQMILFAKSVGLDWLEFSDHNTITQLDFFNALQKNEPEFLLLPGIEYTTYAGHANAIGATKWVDHKIGQPGVTIAGAVDQILDQGALFSINHPILELGNLCIGCAWKHEIDPAKVTSVEIGTGAGTRIFLNAAIDYWEKFTSAGYHVAAVGGSDDHSGGKPSGTLPASIGSPTTLVLADELSAAAIVDGIRKGRTVVKLDGPTAPMVELSTTGGAVVGDAVAVPSARMRVVVTKGIGDTVRLVKNGIALDQVDVTSDPFEHEFDFDELPVVDGKEDRIRAEVLETGRPVTITSHIWIKYGAAETSECGDNSMCAPSCYCSLPKGGSASLPLIGLGLLGAAVGVLRRRR